MKYSEQDELWIPAGYGRQLELPLAASEAEHITITPHPAVRAAVLAAAGLTDQLARGESVPDGPGACARPGCGHGKVWHNPGNRTRECERCGCGSFTDDTTRVPLSCGHRGTVPASLVLQAAYPTAFCESCQDVKPIRQRKPSSRRIGGGVR